jgi:hypothetical protein
MSTVYRTIEIESGRTYRSNDYAVYEYGIYSSDSVLSGQTKRTFIDGGFSTPEEAKSQYPNAEIVC